MLQLRLAGRHLTPRWQCGGEVFFLFPSLFATDIINMPDKPNPGYISTPSDSSSEANDSSNEATIDMPHKADHHRSSYISIPSDSGGEADAEDSLAKARRRESRRLARKSKQKVTEQSATTATTSVAPIPIPGRADTTTKPSDAMSGPKSTEGPKLQAPPRLETDVSRSEDLQSRVQPEPEQEQVPEADSMTPYSSHQPMIDNPQSQQSTTRTDALAPRRLCQGSLCGCCHQTSSP